jgi:hypothetical protein
VVTTRRKLVEWWNGANGRDWLINPAIAKTICLILLGNQA